MSARARDFLERSDGESIRMVPWSITEVEENSPAWNEGLRAEMTISHVGGDR